MLSYKITSIASLTTRKGLIHPIVTFDIIAEETDDQINIEFVVS